MECIGCSRNAIVWCWSPKSLIIKVEFKLFLLTDDIRTRLLLQAGIHFLSKQAGLVLCTTLSSMILYLI